jgi:hypothetical protein
MGYTVITASGTAYAGHCVLTSIVFCPVTQTSAGCTIFDTNASAASSAVKVMHITQYTATGTVVWSDPRGVNCKNGLYVIVSSAYTSVFWD